RGAWDYSAPNVEKWKTTVTGSLGYQAAQAVLRGRQGVSAPDMRIPITLPSFPGPAVTRTYYGYNGEYVADVLDDLMGEGLDIYFEPRNITNGDFDWYMHADVALTADVEHEFHVTSDDVVTGFSES